MKRMIPIETIDYISAIIILGLFTSMIASFLKLSKDVDEKIESVEAKYVKRRTERVKAEYEKLMRTLQESQSKSPSEMVEAMSVFSEKSAYIDFELIHEILEGVYDFPKNLRLLRDAIFGAIILFSFTIFVSITIYSEYCIIPFLIGFLALFYASYKLMQLVSTLRK